MPRRLPITLHLNAYQADLLYNEMRGNLTDYEAATCLEPEEETAIRTILAKLEFGIRRREASAQLELERLRAITAAQPQE